MVGEITITRSEDASGGRYAACVAVHDGVGEQLRFVSRCSFVKALFQRHGEWSDVMGS